MKQAFIAGPVCDFSVFQRWHSFLATLAEEWVDLCSWGHGQLSQDPNQRSFESVGQSMFASQSVNVNIVDVIQQWYGQEANFDLNTLKCKGGDLCQLYTQVGIVELPPTREGSR